MPTDSAALSPIQQQVLQLLATGLSVSAAADTAGVHRNTIANWRRNSPGFIREYNALFYEQSLLWRDGLQALTGQALETIRLIMANGSNAPGVRLRAALGVVDRVAALPVPPPDTPPDNVIAMPTPTQPAETEAANEADAAANNLTVPLPAEPLKTKKLAQSRTIPTPIRGPKSAARHARNQPCSCGSTLKFKNCCLRKAIAA